MADYLPGPWWAAVGPRSVAVVEPVAQDLLNALWKLVADGAGVWDLLEAVTRNGLSSLPSFALLSWHDGPVLVLREGFSARIEYDDAGQDLVVIGRGVRTWTEQPLLPGGRVHLEGSSLTPGVGDLPLLPVVAGVVLFSALKIDLGAGQPPPAGDPAPRDAASAPPEPTTDEMSAPATSETDEPVVPDPKDHAHTDSDAGDPHNEYDGLFGGTIFRSIEDAAVRVDGEPQIEAATSEEPTAASPSMPGSGTSTWVGTLEPPERGLDPQPSVEVHLSVSTGEQVAVSGPVLLGRDPEPGRFVFESAPTLVSIDSLEVSRTHVRIEIDETGPVVTDLGSTNGTFLTEPDGEARRLAAHARQPITDGCVLGLGEAVTVAVRVES